MSCTLQVSIIKKFTLKIQQGTLRLYFRSVSCLFPGFFFHIERRARFVFYGELSS